MRKVHEISMFRLDECNGCGICEKVCPTGSIELRPSEEFKDVDAIGKSLPFRDHETCFACGACEQRCLVRCIDLIGRNQVKELSGEYYMFEDADEIEEEATFGTDASEVDYDRVVELCKKAKFLPKEIVCYCTRTRAEEVAAAILKGAEDPEDLSRMTGMTSGCKVECIQPKLRILHAAGKDPEPPKDKWTWTGRTSTVRDVPEEVKEKFSERGFYFDLDIEFFERALSQEKSKSLTEGD